MYYKQEKFAFFVIFHEFMHYEVDDKIEKGIYDEDTIRVIEEELIDSKLSKRYRKKHYHTHDSNYIRYYYRNYDLVYAEALANRDAWIFTMEFLDKIGIEITPDERKEILKMVRDLELVMNNKYRRPKDNQWKTVDELLEMIIKKSPYLLDKYPFLQEEYCILGKNVERRIIKR